MEHDGKSSIGLEEGLVAAASYFPGVGLLLLFLEKKSHFVRFHAVQSCLGHAILLLWCLAVSWIPPLHFLRWSYGLLALAFTAYMMYRSYDGEEYRLPLIGNLAFGAVYETEPHPDSLMDSNATPPNDEAAENS